MRKDLQMERNAEQDRRRADELIEQLAPKQTTAVVVLLESILDPVSRALANAPMDDEPVSAEEEAAVEESREWLKHNKGIPHEQVLAELGITPEEIKRLMKSV
jgi:hypothetical protein